MCICIYILIKNMYIYIYMIHMYETKELEWFDGIYWKFMSHKHVGLERLDNGGIIPSIFHGKPTHFMEQYGTCPKKCMRDLPSSGKFFGNNGDVYLQFNIRQQRKATHHHHHHHHHHRKSTQSTQVGELNPFWRSSMNVEVQWGWENKTLIEDLQ